MRLNSIETVVFLGLHKMIVVVVVVEDDDAQSFLTMAVVDGSIPRYYSHVQKEKM